MKRDNLVGHRVARKKTKTLAYLKGNCRRPWGDALAFHRNALQHLQIELYHALVLLIRARRVGRNVGGRSARFDELVVDEVMSELFAAHVGRHAALEFRV